jgi:two-component system, OmpR family, sensor histidine kinase QseC
MTPSIKRFLLFYLLLSLILTASINVASKYMLDSADIQKQFDTQLKRTADFMYITLLSNKTPIVLIQKIINKHAAARLKQTLNKERSYFIEEFQFQIYDEKGKLLAHTIKAPIQPWSKIDGLKDVKIEDAIWRVYTKTYPKIGLRISVAEASNFREALRNQITLNNLLSILIIYPLLALLICLTVTLSLKSLKKLTAELANRKTTDFSLINLKNAPIEIQPLIEELNQLFLKLKEAFNRNKRFASDAAHELRTPLAALKTQTQVALLAATENEKAEVLRKIIMGADRCTHIVQQLLTLSRLGKNETLDDKHPINLHIVAAEIIAQLVPQAVEKNIEIELIETKNKEVVIYGNEIAIGILIRNIVDNAIRYTPNNGYVKVEIINNIKNIILKTTDSGPGIPEELRERVFERFFRVLGTQAAGSGLGLAIVHQIATLHHATIKLETPQNGKGLTVKIVFKI